MVKKLEKIGWRHLWTSHLFYFMQILQCLVMHFSEMSLLVVKVRMYFWIYFWWEEVWYLTNAKMFKRNCKMCEVHITANAFTLSTRVLYCTMVWHIFSSCSILIFLDHTFLDHTFLDHSFYFFTTYSWIFYINHRKNTWWYLRNYFNPFIVCTIVCCVWLSKVELRRDSIVT